LMQASRNGYFFLLDRATGEHLLTAPYVAANWARGLDKQGRPIPNPDKEPRPDGTLVNPSTGGAANWPPPSFDPGTGLLFVNINNFSGIYYLTDVSRKPAGFGGREEFLAPQPMITAIDYRTGQATWTHPLTPGINSSGLLSTEGEILLSGDSEQNFGAFATRSGKSLWHVGLGALVSNAPITYELNGRQYIVVAAGMDLYAFSLPLAAIERP
jgi:glucose dehydrogenase